MNKIFNFRLFPILLLTLILTIILTSGLGLAFGLISVAILAIIGAVLVCIYKKFQYAKRIILFVLVATIAVFVTIGYGESYSKIYNIQNVDITGKISVDTPFDGDGNVVGSRIILDNVTCGEETLTKRVEVYIATDEQDKKLTVGDVVTLRGNIETKQFKYFETFSAFNVRNKIAYQLRSGRITDIKADKLTVVDSIKVNIKRVLYLSAPQNAENIYAMMFGDKSNMPTGDKAVFSSIGIAHLFAVSGLHIGIIAGALALILRKLKVNKYLRFAISTVVLLCYGAICNFSPSVVRSIVMVTVFECSTLLGARSDGVSSMSLAGVILLLFNPIALFDISFVLTMLAVYGILCFYKPIMRRMSRLPKWVASTLALSIAVNIMVLPVLLTSFGAVSYKFILASILIMPIISAIFPFLLSLSFIAMIPYLWYVLVPFEYIFIAITYISGLIANMPLPRINFLVDWWVIIPYIVLMTVISNYCMCANKLKKIVASIVVLGIMTLTTINIVESIKNKTIITTISADEYKECEVVIAGGKGYVIARGGIDFGTLRLSMNYLYKQDIFEIDTIVMADFDTYATQSIIDSSKNVKINAICSYSIIDGSLASLVGGNVSQFVSDKYIQILFNNAPNEIYMLSQGVHTLFLEDKRGIINLPPCLNYDIIFTTGDKAIALNYGSKVFTRDELSITAKTLKLYDSQVQINEYIK